MDIKATKEEKKKQKLEKFLQKKLNTTKITKTHKPIKKSSLTGYDPLPVEEKWNNFWINNNLFKPQHKDKKFVISMPPPNVTGSLHIGHAMMVAIQDSICRYKRMRGYEVLYLPGTDHAGIATQTVVLKQLEKENKKCNREEFLEATWQWKEKYGSRIMEQFKRLGTSADLSRQRFTMDSGMNKSVTEAFCRLYEKGLIYRDNKIVNWCGKLQTTLSDIEINHLSVPPNTFIKVDGRDYEFGVIYVFKYPVRFIEEIVIDDNKIGINIIDDNKLGNNVIDDNKIDKSLYGENKIGDYVIDDNKLCINIIDDNKIDKSLYGENKIGKYVIDDNKSIKNKITEGYIEVGTTRPETILGDVALCANPNDKRYTKYKKIIPINPLTGEELDFVFDEAADMELECGVLKITPAHDPVDFDIGKKHKLPQIVIFDSHNKISCENEYKGLSRLDARDLVINKLKEKNLFIEKKPHEQILPICSRSNDLIEPVIKEQWWCDCTNMAKKAIDAVKYNKIEIHPEESKEDWYRWFENSRDWCLSRQLWWGHRIPAYKSPSNEWSIGRTKQEAIKSFYENNIISKIFDESEWVQDDDVLDTWFSSGLWPFATLGWPDKTADFDNYFPTSLLETGKDILFFWVGRMVMLSLELTDLVPFKNILLHGIVRDANGRKMSKSLGNVIDPIHVIDGSSLENLLEGVKSGNISKDKIKTAESVIRKDFPNGIEACGADALRFTLLSYVSGTNDIKLDIERVKGNRKFCNKIWNASIFVKKIFDEFIKEDNIKECKNSVEGNKKQFENSLEENKKQFENLEGNKKDRKNIVEENKKDRKNIVEGNKKDRKNIVEENKKDRKNSLEENKKDRKNSLEENKKDRKNSLEENKKDRKNSLEENKKERSNSLEENKKDRKNIVEENIKDRKNLVEENKKQLDNMSKRSMKICDSRLEGVYENILEGLDEILKNTSDDLIVWIIQKRDKMISSTRTGFKEYNFMNATQSIHQFFLYDFCDVYIEIVKKIKDEIYTRVLFFILIDCLKVFSSYMPFISEEVYSKFFNKSLLNAEFPKEINNRNSTNFEMVLNKVKYLRTDIEKNKRNKISVVVGSDEDISEVHLQYIKSLIYNIQDIKMGDKSEIIDLN